MKKLKKGICFVLICALCFGALTAMTSVSAEGVVYGDCNDDQEVNSKDSLLLRQYIAKYDATINEEAADVVYDGKINSKDSLVLRQYIANYDVALGPTTTQPVVPMNVYTVDQMLSSSNLVGRSVVDGSVLKMEHTTSGIEFMANCEGDIAFEVTCSGNGGYMGVMIDDDFDNMVRVTLTGGTATYTVDANLIKGTHKIRLVKVNEWARNQMELLSVSISGELTGEKPQEKALKLEFYGDSSAVGYGNLSNGGSGKGGWQWQDSYRAYPAFCANALGAEFSTVAASGHGVTTGYSSTDQTYKKFYEYSLVSSQTPWDFNSYVADIVVINLGSNDRSYYNNNRIEKPAEEFKAACLELIESLHEKNPTCEIVWCIGTSYIVDTEYFQPLTVLQEIDEELDYVHFKKLHNVGGGGDNHPSVAGSEKAGLELAEFIQTEILDQQ